MGTKRNVDTGKKDSIGRAIKESENSLAAEGNVDSKKKQLSHAAVSSDTQQALESYTSFDLADELNSSIAASQDFLDSDNYQDFVKEFQQINEANNIMWEEDGELIFDEEKWAEHSPLLEESLETAYDNYQGQDDFNSEEVINEEQRAVKDSLLDPYGVQEDMNNLLFTDGQQPDDWDIFVEESPEAQDVILGYNNRYDFAYYEDGEVVLDEDFFMDCRDEMKMELIEIYQDF